MSCASWIFFLLPFSSSPAYSLPSILSVITAPAPFASASFMYLFPSSSYPIMAKKMYPSFTFLESYARPFTSKSSLISTGFKELLSDNSENFIIHKNYSFSQKSVTSVLYSSWDSGLGSCPTTLPLPLMCTLNPALTIVFIAFLKL